MKTSPYLIAGGVAAAAAAVVFAPAVARAAAGVAGKLGVGNVVDAEPAVRPQLAETACRIDADGIRRCRNR